MRLTINIKKYISEYDVPKNSNIGNFIRNKIDYKYNYPGVSYVSIPTGFGKSISIDNCIIREKQGIATVYNTEYMKRGKYHKSPKLYIYIYELPIEILKCLNLSVKQNNRNFKIYTK